MSENRELKESKPKQNFLTNALKVVKGDNTLQLIEDFTSEMTLVAEGLCDDQGRLRREVEQVRKEQAHLETLLQSERDVQDRALAELQRDFLKTNEQLKARMTQLEDRMDRITEAMDHKMKEKDREQKSKLALFKKGNMIAQLTLLASIICGSWVLVTILNLFKNV